MLFPLAVAIFERRSFHVSADQLIVGAVATGLVIACIVVHYEAMSWSSRLLPRLNIPRRARVLALIAAMMMAHVVEVWIFGLGYWVLDAWPQLGQLVGPVDEGALDFIYFSVSCYTTLGFGDIVPAGPTRILAGAEALAGLSLITWTASFAFLEMQRDWTEFSQAE